MNDAVADLRVLGPIDLVAPGGPDPEPLLRQPKRVALLVYLTLATADTVTRSELVDLFWSDVDERRGRVALRQALKFLREHLPEGVIVARGRRALGVDRGLLGCDALVFEERLAEDRLVGALDLYDGDLLQGFPLDAQSGFARWLEARRARLRARASRAARDLAGLAESSGHAVEAAFWTKRGLSHAGLSEESVARAMETLLRLRDARGALRAYRGLLRMARFEPGPGSASEPRLVALAQRAERMVEEASSSTPTAPGRRSFGGARRSGTDRRTEDPGWDGAERREGRDRRRGEDRREPPPVPDPDVQKGVDAARTEPTDRTTPQER